VLFKLKITHNLCGKPKNVQNLTAIRVQSKNWPKSGSGERTVTENFVRKNRLLLASCPEQHQRLAAMSEEQNQRPSNNRLAATPSVVAPPAVTWRQYSRPKIYF